ncbi:hypothetical protein QC764_0023740 [Podospora pseudoanserina]|uniref:Uncharacterized protein n=1 Tax=Podospora pseudoanserina TaxID=2609844 RepID=A0ABR0IRX7_9PEZI|nr:hypothetical protein QC764_0023740 [Podospora pseudoanserina]
MEHLDLDLDLLCSPYSTAHQTALFWPPRGALRPRRESARAGSNNERGKDLLSTTDRTLVCERYVRILRKEKKQISASGGKGGGLLASGSWPRISNSQPFPRDTNDARTSDRPATDPFRPGRSKAPVLALIHLAPAIPPAFALRFWLASCCLSTSLPSQICWICLSDPASPTVN